MRVVKEIIVHCSATKPTMDIGADEIRQWHVHERNWSDIGYHLIIRRDGTLEAGRPIKNIGAHCRGHNQESIGICMVGGLSDDGKPDCNFNLSQYKTLSKTIRDLVDQYHDIEKISGHREHAPMKACPTFDVEAFMEGEGIIL